MKPCRIADCDRPVLAHDLCAFHYKRRRFGRALEAPYRPKAILPKNHPVYAAWTNMKTRCNNPKSTQYKWYGGRGIHYSPNWETFAGFYYDMFPSWERGLILDRRDNNGNYTKENCRWVTEHESSMNRSSNIIWAEEE